MIQKADYKLTLTPQMAKKIGIRFIHLSNLTAK